jgi:hypothetical protein
MAFGDRKGLLVGSAASIPNPAVMAGSVAVVIGDLVYAVVGEQTAPTTTTASDNLGNTYTATAAATDAGTSTGHAYWSRVTVAGTLTAISVVATASGQNWAGSAAVYEGPFATSPLDANPANITSDITSPFNCPTTGTLAFAGSAKELVVGWGVHTGSTVWAATSPNLLDDNEATAAILAVALGSQVVTVTTAVVPVFTAAANPTDAVLGTTSFKSAGSAVDTKAGIFPSDRPPVRPGRLRRQRIASEMSQVLVEPPAPPVEETAVAMAYAIDDTIVSRDFNYDPLTGSVFAPEAPAVTLAIGMTEQPARARGIKRVSEATAWAPQSPIAAVVTPDIFGYQTSVGLVRIERKKSQDAYAAIVSQPTVVVAVTLAYGIDDTTVARSFVVDPVAGPVFLPTAAVATPTPFGHQIPDLPPKTKSHKIEQGPSSFVFAIPIDDYGFQAVAPYSKPIRKKLSEPFAWAAQAFVFVATPTPFGYQAVPSYAKPIPKRLSEPFAWGPQRFDAVATPSAFGYQTIDPFRKFVGKKLSEPFAWDPQSFIVLTPSAFGYQTVEPYRKFVAKKLSEPLAWDPQAFDVVVTPSAFGYQAVEPYRKFVAKKLSEPFAWDPRPFVATPDVFGYQTIDPFRKFVVKKLSEPFTWDPQSFVVVTPSVFGYQTVAPYAKPIRKRLSGDPPYALSPPAPPVATPSILFSSLEGVVFRTRGAAKFIDELAAFIGPLVTTVAVRRVSTRLRGHGPQFSRDSMGETGRNNLADRGRNNLATDKGENET